MNEAHITHLQVHENEPHLSTVKLRSVLLLAFFYAVAFLSLLFTLPPMVVVAQTPSNHFMFIAQDINYDIAQDVIKMESDYVYECTSQPHLVHISKCMASNIFIHLLGLGRLFGIFESKAAFVLVHTY